MRIYKSIIFAAAIIFYMSAVAFAQEISVIGCEELQGDETAESNPRYDVNEQQCALLKIMTNGVEGLKFTNRLQYVGDVQYSDSTYLVYLPGMTYKVSFSHDDYLPGIIDLSVFGFKNKIKGGKTYKVVLDAPKKLVFDNYVSFKISPFVKGCTVAFNDQLATLPENGIIEFKCSEGNYDYKVYADGYETIVGNVKVAKGIVPLSLQLNPSMVDVNVKINVKASIFVDDVYYGSSGKIKLPLGRHNIRMSAEGYLDEDADVIISDKNRVLTYNLRKNNGKTVDVHPIPVIVHCNSNQLYKNNKLVKGWKDGKAIMLMPGTKCKLTDDDGKGALLSVKNTSMEVMLRGNTIEILR